MRETLADDNLRIRSAEEAADQLFNARNGDTASYYEPTDPLAAEAAVRHLGKLFNDLPGAIAEALSAARDSGDLLSSDKLQGISEIIQNADDVDASQVRLVLGPTDLWVGHNGRPVQLRHVLGLATPWLTTKRSEADPIGRFGIGLMTLRSISNALEVHCHPYHVQIGNRTLSPIDPLVPPPGLEEAGWTTFRIPFEQGMVSAGELAEWLTRWDSSALLFLSRVSRVTLLDVEGTMIRELSTLRSDAGEVVPTEWNPNRRVSRCGVETGDGRSWLVYTEEIASPVGVRRTRKATDTTTPIAIALPQYSVDYGQIHAGLPVIRTRLPIFANAQFDPITNRRDFANNDWNRALVPLVADLWSRAALDLFARDPKAAWQAMPLPDIAEGNVQSPFVAELEDAIVAQARKRVASQLSLPVPGQGEVRLADLAVEARPLEQILTVTETSVLAGLPATLPFELRDQTGRWRTVLEDWRRAGANIPDEVSVEQALELVSDEIRPVSSTVALVAVGLEEGFNARLMELPCIIAQDGRHMVPPSGDSPTAVAAETTPLAEQLGVVTLLHAEHLGRGKAAVAVLKWLRSCGALLDISDNRNVVRRLATAGKAGRRIETPLTDLQVQALRDAFEGMDLEELRDLGPDIGRAVTLEAYEYVAKGRKRQRMTTAYPADAYLPRAINRGPDSFPIAASNSVGITWISNQYAKVLRSPSGREGIGAQRFLRLLGAEAAPRLRLHPMLERRYISEPRRGLSVSIPGSPHVRSQAMQGREATYTLQDRDCPTLAAVIHDISRMSRKKTRRNRAGSLLATLGRAWDRLYSEFSEVESARASYGWQLKGRMPAYWIWVAGDIAWLDDESGTPRRPSDLRLRTPGNVAIYGQDSPDYLHPDLDQPNWRLVLAALGVSGDPSRTELVTRLKELRDDAEDEGRWPPEELKRKTAVLYKALAQSLTQAVGRPGLGVEQLRRDFQHLNGLIFTNLGWLPPQGVLAGPPIFGKHRAFAPAVADTDPLWAALRLREPSFQDCIDVIRAVARKHRILGPDDEAILLETLRVLASHAETGFTTQARAKLRRLPLWTSKGWVRDRPVYATDDPVLIAGLRNQLPLWEPGGELQQFRSLLHPLRIEEIDADAAQVIEPDQATEDEDSSDLFRLALQLLQEDLSRNDPQLAKGTRMSWDLLGEFGVYVHSSLAVGVNVGLERDGTRYECEVAAKVDIDRRRVFVQHPEQLPRVDTGGRAIATLFEGDARRLSQAWRAACDQAESGRQVRLVELAEEQVKREQQQTESELAEFRERTIAIQQRRGRSRGLVNRDSGPSGTATIGRENRETPPILESTRVLVNPESLDIVDPKGRLESSEQRTPRKTGGDRNLVEPKPVGGGPRGRSPIRLYTDLQKENVGMELLRKLLSSDVEEIADIRAQHGVGADAVDKLKHFYELKVSAGTEPDYVKMTAAEVKRARTTPGFFLIVISGIEGVNAQPRVRVIVDPLSQLQPTPSGSITLSGVRNATSLTYDFAHRNDAEQASEENETDVSGE